MTLPPAITRQASCAGRWVLRRAQERSTYAGLGLLLTALGYGALGDRIDHLGSALLAIGLIGGGGLVAASTTPAAGG